MKVELLLSACRVVVAVAALVLLLGLAAQAETFTQTIDLGPQTIGLVPPGSTGTQFMQTLNGGIIATQLESSTANSTTVSVPAGTANTGNTWIAAGTLPLGSTLEQLSINAEFTGAGTSSASDLNVVVGGALDMWGYENTFANQTTNIQWNGNTGYGFGNTVTDTINAVGYSASGLLGGPSTHNFPAGIDLNSSTVYLADGYGTGTWSGSVSITYDVGGPTWTGANGTTVWSDSGNWSTGVVPDGVGQSLSFGSSGATAAVTLNSNRTAGAIYFASNVPTTISSSNGSVLTLDNSGTAATLEAEGAAQHTIATGLTLADGVIVNMTDPGGGLILSGAIGGVGGITMNGLGLLTLSNTANTFSGDTTINSGTVRIAGLGSLGSGNITFEGGTLQYPSGSGASTLDISGRINPIDGGQAAIIDTNGNNVSFATPISGAGGLTKLGAGTLTFAVNNTYTGPTTLNAGGLVVNTGTVANLNVNAGTATVNSSASVTTLNSAGGATNINGTVGALTVSGGTVSANSTAAVTGLTTVVGGLLQVNAAQVFQNSNVSAGAAGTVTFASGVGTFSFGGLSGNALLPLQDASAAPVTLQVGANNADSVFNGTLSGPGGLNKIGAGTLTISGTQAYAGPTVVVAGTLHLQPLTLGAVGLWEGVVSTTQGNPLDTTDPIPQTTVQLSARWGTSTTSGGGTSPITYPNWPDNTTIGYSGYFYAPVAGTYTFGKSFDDAGYLAIGGSVIINDSNWTDAVTQTATLSQGWHNIDLRFGQGGGGVGPQGAFGNFGIAYEAPGSSTWTQFADPGNGSVLTTSYAVGGSNVLPIGSALLIGGSATLDLDLGGGSQQVAGLSDYAGSGGTITTSGSSLATLDVSQSGNSTFSGTISNGSGQIALVKDGSGSLTLSGSNSFSGGTNVVDGTLVLDGAAALLAGSSLTIGSAPGSGGGIVVPGEVATPQATPTLAPVPEPGTLALLVVGILGILAMNRKRR